MMGRRFSLLGIVLVVLLAGCTFGFDPNTTTPIAGGTTGGGGSVPAGEDATVNFVIDGDTIDVTINGQSQRVRYIGVNTPERDEVCYNEARQANTLFVNGKTVRLVKDVENTDRYDRLLRYVYVDGLFVNQALIEQGYAEVVSYPPNTAHYQTFRQLEQEARNANRGCHPTGIFNDGSDTR
ncbi:MAG: thermonuclease family protein [Anaerolineae bacterium]|nr:thermonuclease family protein [Anaerolineae bacterium]